MGILQLVTMASSPTDFPLKSDQQCAFRREYLTPGQRSTNEITLYKTRRNFKVSAAMKRVQLYVLHPHIASNTE